MVNYIQYQLEVNVAMGAPVFMDLPQPCGAIHIAGALGKHPLLLGVQWSAENLMAVFQELSAQLPFMVDQQQPSGGEPNWPSEENYVTLTQGGVTYNLRLSSNG